MDVKNTHLDVYKCYSFFDRKNSLVSMEYSFNGIESITIYARGY